MFKKVFLALVAMISLTSCVSKIAMDKQSFYKEKKIGVIVTQDSMSIYRAGAQGLLDMAISSGRKYKEPLKQISPQFNPKENILKVIEQKFAENGKNYIIINDVINLKDFPKYEVASKDDDKFLKQDVRSLKTKYDIDQLMLIKINYGLSISYYGMIETGRFSTTSLFTQIINLDNNQIIFRDPYENLIPIKGKWNEPPHYENLSGHIKKSIDKSMEDFTKNF